MQSPSNGFTQQNIGGGLGSERQYKLKDKTTCVVLQSVALLLYVTVVNTVLICQFLQNRELENKGKKEGLALWGHTSLWKNLLPSSSLRRI